MKEFLKLAVAIAVCQGAGIIGSIFTVPAIETWYAALVKPSLSPPNWVFAPVWITLYTLMGISLYLVWRKSTKENCHCFALQLFLFQLSLNVVWSYLFFGLQEPLLALFGIVFLNVVVVLVMWRFWYIQKVAAYLLLPYAVWIAFAMYLNFMIWQLN
jgi:translocator protein